MLFASFLYHHFYRLFLEHLLSCFGQQAELFDFDSNYLWNQANKLQAEDRAHRIGTTQTVHVRTYITKGTIDEKINELVYGKGNLSKYLVDGDVDYKPVDLTRLVLGLEEKGVNKVVK